MPWLEDSDMPAARGWAELEYLCGLCYAEIRTRGVLTTDGHIRDVVDAYRRLRLTQVSLSKELGMTPSARIALKATGTKASLDLAKACADIEDANTAPAEE